MRQRKLLIILVILLCAVAAVGVIVYQRMARPPRAVLLLPEGNFVFYLNFSPAHFLDLGKIPAAESDPEYQDFLQQTGFHFEHDLNTLAVSQGRPGDPDSESAAVFTGRFDQEKLRNYLQKISAGTEKYADKTIFTVRRENHIVRACILDPETVGITNMQSLEPMHTIIDKARSSFPTPPSLVKNYYRDVPFASVTWALLHISSEPTSQLPGDIKMDFLQNTTSVASLRYTGSIRFRLEVISTSEANANNVTQSANTFLVLGRGAVESLNTGGPDKDVKEVFDSIQVQQNGNRTIVTLVIPQNFVKKMSEAMNR